MWCYTRMLGILKISCIYHVTNYNVLERTGKEKVILFPVKTRELSYFKYIMRGGKYKILTLIIQGKVVERKGRERRIRNIIDRFNNG